MQTNFHVADVTQPISSVNSVAQGWNTDWGTRLAHHHARFEEEANTAWATKNVCVVLLPCDSDGDSGENDNGIGTNGLPARTTIAEEFIAVAGKGRKRGSRNTALSTCSGCAECSRGLEDGCARIQETEGRF